MALSKEHKQALNDHFENRDVYEPAKDPRQEPADFAPKCLCGKGCTDGMCGGGKVGYDNGGMVDPTNDVTMPSSVDVSTDTTMNSGLDTASDATGDEDLWSDAPTSPTSIPEQSPKSKLAPDEYQDLISSLKRGPGMGQSVMSGLGSLADGIMQGVARAGNPGFAKNIQERKQQQKENLINALRAKYETGFRGKELGLRGEELDSQNTRAANQIAAENTRSANSIQAEKERNAANIQAEKERNAANIRAEKERTNAELGVRAQEAQAGRAQSGIEAAAKLPATGILHPSTWGRGSDIENVRQQLLGQGIKRENIPVVRNHSDYLKLPKGTQYQNEKGERGVKN